MPGQLSQFVRHENYWDGPAWVDELFIYDFADDAAKVNALLAGQVQSVDNLPNYLAGTIEQQGASPLVSETGAWVPFTMRVDVEPFSDVRVRQALRLIVDRQQMIDQALNGFGVLGNDLYSPFDPAYAKDLPQRMQDIDQAKSLLRQAGQENLDVELVTSTAVGAGAVESANLFVEQARLAGVTVRLNKADANVFYGDRYLSWNFAQDFWNTRNYIPQVATCSVRRRHLQRDPLRRPGLHRADRPGQAGAGPGQAHPAAARRAGDRVQHRRLHHLGLQAPARRLLQPGPGPGTAPLPAVLELRVQERVLRPHHVRPRQ